MLLGQLVYSTVELLQLSFIILFGLSVALLNSGNPEANKMFLTLAVASQSVYFVLLPMIQIFAAPQIRTDLKECLIRFMGSVLSHLFYSTRRCVKSVSKPPQPQGVCDEFTLCPMHGNPINEGLSHVYRLESPSGGIREG